MQLSSCSNITISAATSPLVQQHYQPKNTHLTLTVQQYIQKFSHRMLIIFTFIKLKIIYTSLFWWFFAKKSIFWETSQIAEKRPSLASARIRSLLYAASGCEREPIVGNVLRHTLIQLVRSKLHQLTKHACILYARYLLLSLLPKGMLILQITTALS